jgi:hypothetical protein
MKYKYLPRTALASIHKYVESSELACSMLPVPEREASMTLFWHTICAVPPQVHNKQCRNTGDGHYV